MPSLEVASLRCLITLLRERSVSRAAHHLDLSQPAVSHMLARLRRYFDDPLLVRSGQGMLPTPRALELSDEAHAIVEAMDRLSQVRQVFNPAKEERAFVITLPEFLERVLAPPLLERLQREAPNVAVEM